MPELPRTHPLGGLRAAILGGLEPALVDYVLAWIPYGGPPGDQTFLRFGITNQQVAERIWQAIQRRPRCPTHHLRLVMSLVTALAPAMLSDVASPRPTVSKAPGPVDPAPTVHAPHLEPSDATTASPFDWQQHAKCRELALDVFYGPDSERGGRRARSEKRAKTICRGCPVVRDCLEHALMWPEPYGIWGATTPAERRRMR